MMWRFLKIFGFGGEESRGEEKGGEEVLLIGDRGKEEVVRGDDVRGPVKRDLESFGFAPEDGNSEEMGTRAVIDKQLRKAAKKERRRNARMERQRAALEGRRLGVHEEGKRERTMSKASLTGGEVCGSEWQERAYSGETENQTSGETAAQAATGTASSTGVESGSWARRRVPAVSNFL
jgi:hypothetical protein